MGSTVLAAAMLAVALGLLLPAPRSAALTVAGSTRDATALGNWAVRFGRLHWRLGLLVGLAGWFVGGSGAPGVVIGLGSAAGAMWLVRWLEAEPERQRQRALVAQLPGCLDLLGPALDAGVPLRAAVRHVARLAPEPSAGLLQGVLGHLEIGRSDAQAWSTLRGHPVWGPIARDLARCAESGTAVAQVLGVHAAEARARRRAQREAAARTVGVRSVLPLVCCFLPAFVLVGVVPIIAATIGGFLNL